VEQRELGKDAVAAAIEAASLRFRPVMMTSFAFIFGLFPLVIAHGAGAATRHAVGTPVFGGMIAPPRCSEYSSFRCCSSPPNGCAALGAARQSDTRRCGPLPAIGANISANMGCEPAHNDRGVTLADAEFHHLLIADDHPLFRGALREAVNGCSRAPTSAKPVRSRKSRSFLERGGDVDLILLDLRMPGVRGFSGLMYLRAQLSRPADRGGLGQ